MQAETTVNSPMTNLPMTNLPTRRFAELPKLLEGEHPCEPKFFGSSGDEPSSEPKFSVVQEHDPPVRRIFCRSGFSRDE